MDEYRNGQLSSPTKLKTAKTHSLPAKTSTSIESRIKSRSGSSMKDPTSPGRLGASMNSRMFVVSRMSSSDADDDLNEYELLVLRCSAEGNLEEMKKIFVQQTYYLFSLNVNCVDSLDRTPLCLAILNGHLHVIQYLLSDEIENLEQGDALFYAIQCEFYEAIELLLVRAPQTSLKVRPGTTSPFPPGLTPFMLAAHKNNYRILSMLYTYFHRLTSIRSSIYSANFDPYSWDGVMERIHHYKAKASPAFMLLMYNKKGIDWDPLSNTMDLFGELKDLAKCESEVVETYSKLARRCESFAMDLLQEVRSAKELAGLMRYSLEEDYTTEHEVVETHHNDSGSIHEGSQTSSYLKPINTAVRVEMKDFVTSDNSQLALIYIQKGKLFRRLDEKKGTAVQIFLGLMFPILSMAFLLAPNSSMGRLMSNPTVKFMGWLVSEIVFVLMLLTNTILSQGDISYGYNKIPPLLLVAYFWILGKLIQEVRELSFQGFREYFSDIWNWNDVFTIFFYSGFMIFRLIHIREQKNDPSGNKLHLDTFSPLTLSDICIAIAYVLIHLRIMELLRVHRTFGPLQATEKPAVTTEKVEG